MAGVRVRGRIRPPGDKSLSHRALIFAALSEGESLLQGLNAGEDVKSTAGVLRACGVEIGHQGEKWHVSGVGPRGLRPPRRSLDCGNSGTTFRLLTGVFAALDATVKLTGDASLRKRPMHRVREPLVRMGAEVTGRERGDEIVAPLTIRGGNLRPIVYDSPVASAQVKSAILLAGWMRGVPVSVTEPARSRDHTERMMRALGQPVARVPGGVRLERFRALRAPQGVVPGDPSQAAFFAAAAAALPGSDLRIDDVCLNSTRLGFFRALARMGARVDTTRERSWCGEPVGTIRVRAGRLEGVAIGARQVPSMIDEVPALAAIAAGAAKGSTRISGAAELRHKESDRIAVLAEGLSRLGAEVEERADGLRIEGGQLRGGNVDSREDHRIVMAFRVADLLASGKIRIRGSKSVRVSHPGFERSLARLVEGGR